MSEQSLLMDRAAKSYRDNSIARISQFYLRR